MRWTNIAEFDAWCQMEELAYSIEFITAWVTNGKVLYLEKHDYVCSCQVSRGGCLTKKSTLIGHARSGARSLVVHARSQSSIIIIQR